MHPQTRHGFVLVLVVICWSVCVYSQENCSISNILNLDHFDIYDRQKNKLDDHTNIESGDNATIQCKRGYKSVKNETEIHCNQGQWLGEMNCTEESCSKPDILHAEIEERSEDFLHGTNVSLKCKSGFVYPDDLEEKMVTCEYGSWTNLPRKCRAKKCSIDKIPDFNHFDVYDKKGKQVDQPKTIKSGRNLTLQCKRGFQSNQNATTIRCEHGRWLGLGVMNCMAKTCSISKIPDFDHLDVYDWKKTKVDHQTSIKSGNNVIVQCKKGFQSDLNATKIQCNQGQWLGKMNCTAKACQVPDVKNGFIDGSSKSFPHLSTINVYCQIGFEFDDRGFEFNATCMLGNWSKAIPPKCSAKKCSMNNITDWNTITVKSREGDILNDMEFASHGTDVYLSCPSGHVPKDNISVSTCTEGEWSNPLICKTAKCIVPDINDALLYDDQGMIPLTEGSQLYNEHEIFIACQNDKVINEEPFKARYKRILCSNGTWAELPPKACVSPNDCDLHAPEHAELIVGNTTLKDDTRITQIDVKCNRGYDIYFKSIKIPLFRAQCVDGQMKKSLPKCKRNPRRRKIPCKSPDRNVYSINNFQKGFKSYLGHKGTINVRCKSGNNTESHRIKCLDGTWNPKLPSCEVKESKDCYLPTDAKYQFDGGNLNPGDKISQGQLVSVSCTRETFDYLYYEYDYDLSHNNKSILCHSGSIFGLDDIKCEEDLSEECKNSVEHGEVRDHFLGITVKCDKGYKLDRVSSISNGYQCLNDVLVNKDDKKEPKCIPNDCELPDNFNMHVQTWPRRHGLNYLSGSVIVKHMDRILLNCTEAGYEPSNRIVRCIAGNWSEIERDWDFNVNETFPTCKPVKCEPKCEHFGTCIRNNKCKCKRENTGSRCENFKCSKQCLDNGGSCPKSTQCECPKYRHGRDCEFHGCQLSDDSTLHVTRLGGNSSNYLFSSIVVKHMERVLVNCIESGYEPSNRTIQCSAGNWSEVENDWDLDVNETFPTCKPAQCEPKCEHNGQCIRNNKCKCKQANEGDRCDKFKCSKRCEENGGSCPNSTKCVCPKNKHGQYCELYKCEPQCENLGTCIKNNKCKCRNENKGDRCEQFKCSKQCVDNGGSCPTSTKCECPKYRTGIDCQLFKCEPICEHSGQCIQNNNCKCKNETEGDRCEKFKCSKLCIANGGSCPNSSKCQCPKNKHGQNCKSTGCCLPNTSATVVSPRDVYNVYDTVHLTCGAGHRLESNSNFTCLRTGDWSGNAVCVETKIKNYQVRVSTGPHRNAGTSGDVFVKMTSISGKQTDEIKLTAHVAGRSKIFEPYAMDTFIVSTDDIGEIAHIDIRLNGKWSSPRDCGYWYISRVSIYDPEGDKYYGFPAATWISECNRTIQLHYKKGSKSRPCAYTYTSGVKMTVPSHWTAVDPITDIECRMWCSEYKYCYAVAYQRSTRACKLLEQFHFHYAKQWEFGDGSFTVFTRINCSDR